MHNIFFLKTIFFFLKGKYSNVSFSFFLNMLCTYKLLIQINITKSINKINKYLYIYASSKKKKYIIVNPFFWGGRGAFIIATPNLNYILVSLFRID